jgi:acyl-coenzyme A synthetase/AMP-(fatty) acid ligase
VTGAADLSHVRIGSSATAPIRPEVVAEVDAVLALHPAVRSVSVVGTPAPRIEEIGVAFVVPAVPGTLPRLEELRELVRGELADYKAPDRLEIVDQLPANSLMKID